ncbi:MAG: ABC transporter permease [Phycisphaeraceae bacterium]|nr:MAG: ABC transporter permease [Phycisphaeraceae bacterium]
MAFIALKMLFGDRAKYLTLILGLAFATLLINQQASFFLGLLVKGTGPLQNVGQPDLWATDPHTKWSAEYRPLDDRTLDRIRSVPGVKWAEPFFNSFANIEMPDGSFQRCQIIGLPRNSLIGQPPEMSEGSLEDLRAPDAVIIEESARERLRFPNIGDTLKMNERRAVIVGFCRAKKGFEGNAVVYTTVENATRFTPVGRQWISFILVKAQSPADIPAVQQRINNLGDVVALDSLQFVRRTIAWILKETGIGINFGITIFLGFLVGVALSAAIFYQFTIENLRYFAVLKALGAGPFRLASMVLLQATVAGAIGFGLGIGATAAFSLLIRQNPNTELESVLPWQLLLASAGAILFCIVLASLASLRKVIAVSPARVFAS